MVALVFLGIFFYLLTGLFGSKLYYMTMWKNTVANKSNRVFALRHTTKEIPATPSFKDPIYRGCCDAKRTPQDKWENHHGQVYWRSGRVVVLWPLVAVLMVFGGVGKVFWDIAEAIAWVCTHFGAGVLKFWEAGMKEDQ